MQNTYPHAPSRLKRLSATHALLLTCLNYHPGGHCGPAAARTSFPVPTRACGAACCRGASSGAASQRSFYPRLVLTSPQLAAMAPGKSKTAPAQQEPAQRPGTPIKAPGSPQAQAPRPQTPKKALAPPELSIPPVASPTTSPMRGATSPQRLRVYSATAGVRREAPPEQWRPATSERYKQALKPVIAVQGQAGNVSAAKLSSVYTC